MQLTHLSGKERPMNLTKKQVSELKQSPYGFIGLARVDPTKEGVRDAIKEARFSTIIMGSPEYKVMAVRFAEKEEHEANRLMREYHNERVAELVRTKATWLGKPDDWPITVNEFNEIIEGNHRFRAVRHLEMDEIEVSLVQKGSRYPGIAGYPEIW
jgi:hypothetical protein